MATGNMSEKLITYCQKYFRIELLKDKMASLVLLCYDTVCRCIVSGIYSSSLCCPIKKPLSECFSGELLMGVVKITEYLTPHN